MNINITYGADVASAPAGFKAAVQKAVAFVEMAFKSSVNVNMTFDWASLSGSDIGDSNTAYNVYSYASVVAALKSAAAGNPALDDELLPSVDPFSGSTLEVATAEARQLGLTATAPASDSTITLSSGVAWDWDDATGAVSGEYDAVLALIHEITEGLGRSFGSDGALAPSPFALFRYTSDGQIDTSSAAGGYLSLNGGATDLVAMGNKGSDLGDFNVSNGDPYGYGVAGGAGSVTSVDLEAMEAIGYNLNSNFYVGGGASVTLTDLGVDTAAFYNSGAAWNTVHSNLFANVTLWNAQASVFGDDATVSFDAFSAGAADAVSLYNSGEGVDTVKGSNGFVTLVGDDGLDANIEGGSDQIYFDGTSKIEANLSQTNGDWDTVTGSNGEIELDDAQTSIFGGGNQILDYFTDPAGSAVSLYATAGNWDSMEVPNAVIILNGAQLSNYAEDDVIYFNGASDAVSLYDSGTVWTPVWGSNGIVILDGANATVHGGGDTIYFNTTTLSNSAPFDSVSLIGAGGNWDIVQGSKGTVVVSSAQTSIFGGSDTVYLDGASVDAVSLYQTAGAWDGVSGANGTVILNGSQASVTGAGDRIYLSGADDVVSLYATGATADVVSGSNATVILNSAQASLQGGWDTVDLNGTGDIVTLTGTGANQDWVYGANATVNLTGATASVNGSSDTVALAAGATVTLTGSSQTVSLGAAFGLDSATGFVAGDTLSLSKSDWASFAALQSSGDLSQSGNNTQIKLDANDILTLVGAAPSVLSASNVSFV